MPFDKATIQNAYAMNSQPGKNLTALKTEERSLLSEWKRLQGCLDAENAYIKETNVNIDESKSKLKQKKITKEEKDKINTNIKIYKHEITTHINKIKNYNKQMADINKRISANQVEIARANLNKGGQQNQQAENADLAKMDSEITTQNATFNKLLANYKTKVEIYEDYKTSVQGSKDPKKLKQLAKLKKEVDTSYQAVEKNYKKTEKIRDSWTNSKSLKSIFSSKGRKDKKVSHFNEKVGSMKNSMDAATATYNDLK